MYGSSLSASPIIDALDSAQPGHFFYSLSTSLLRKSRARLIPLVTALADAGSVELG